MATKVFISWSGDLSNKLADAVREWLPGVLQFVKPYFTPSDIEKGAKWSSDISGELEKSDIGIICLTKDNLLQPWILFEAGSLSKNLDSSKVCTLLFEVDSTDLTGPLTTFQATKFEKNDFKKLVKTINDSDGESKLDDAVFNEVFDMWWDKLEEKINNILSSHKTHGETENRSERDILEEILELSRLGVKRKRHRRYEINPDVLMDLIKTINELQDAGNMEGSKRIHMALKKIERPIEYLCRHSDFPEIYEEYRMRKHRIHRLIEEDNCDDEKS